MSEPGKTTETRIVEAIKQTLETEHKATRAHLSAELDSVRHNTEITKTRMGDIKRLMKRLLSKFGIGSEDVP